MSRMNYVTKKQPTAAAALAALQRLTTSSRLERAASDNHLSTERNELVDHRVDG